MFWNLFAAAHQPDLHIVRHRRLHGCRVEANGQRPGLVQQDRPHTGAGGVVHHHRIPSLPTVWVFLGLRQV
jgi:hypothetical protein